MILALSSHLAALLIIDMMSVALIAYSMRRILFGRHYEDMVNKKVVAWLMAGLMLLVFGILAYMISHLGMNSYLIGSNSSMVFRALMPLAFAIGAFHLWKNPEN